MPVKNTVAMIFREAISITLRSGLPLHLALGGIAKNMEHAAAQAPGPGQPFIGLHHPRPVSGFLQLTFFIAFGKQRWSEMKFQLVVAFKLAGQLLHECAVTVEARHFIFVFDGHQLEQVLHDRFRQCRTVCNGAFCIPDF